MLPLLGPASLGLLADPLLLAWHARWARHMVVRLIRR